MTALRMNHLLGSAFALALSLACASCSTTFNRDWKEAAHQPETESPEDVTGAWTGTWRSEASGHQGKLRAIVTPIDEKAGTYDFLYHATWKQVLSATFDATHTVKPKGKGYVLTGQQNLGRMFGGTYHYEGTATPTEFKSRYKSDFDQGVFEMARP